MGTMIAWDDPRLRVSSDSRRTSRYRALQSWYREAILGVSPGLDRRGRVIASMLPAEEVDTRPDLNFLTPEAAAYASHRAGEVLRSGGTLDEDRLRRNMLSSMPLCFNIIGSLRTRTEFPSLLCALFDLDIREIEIAECEWAPDRTEHLDDRTAFDAYVVYKDSSHRRCFLAIETKYTEPFSQKEYDCERYRKVTALSGYFREGASDHLRGRTTNQLWRMAMLAASMVHQKEFEAGSIAVLSLADDRRAQAAVEGVREQLVENSFLRSVSLEALTQTAEATQALRLWAETFRTRYLDLTPVTRG